MTSKFDTAIELARWFDSTGKEQTITIQQYNNLVKDQNREQIANFIYQRLHSRYIKPFLFSDCQFTKEFKNGFSIMANCCLLIETLQSFKNGWGDSNRRSEQAFKEFFTTEINFSVFQKMEQAFYKNIRCGILHQGETTGGWRVNRSGTNLFDSTNLIIDSVTFVKEVDVSLKKYAESLKTASWDSEIWDNFRTKMRKIISNCTQRN